MQRSIKLKIIRPYDEKISWEELGYLFRGLSFKICRMSNFCMTRHLLYALKLETENLNAKGHLYCYPQLMKEYPEVPAGIVCAAETRARKLFQKHAVAVLRSDSVLPNFRKDTSIPIPVAGYRLSRDEGGFYYVDVQVLSRQGAKIQKLPGRIRLVTANNWRDKTASKILPQIAEGTIKRGVASIFREKKDWYISIPYMVDDKEDDRGAFVPGLVMGVKLGVRNALCYAFNHSLKRGAVSGDEILSHKEKFWERRKQIQQQYPWSGRKGHGREHAINPLHHLYETERNYRSLVNYRYAKWVVEIAVKNQCGEIHLETTEAYQAGKQKILLRNWPVQDLQNKIRTKAEEKGILVTGCPDAGVWTRCSQCGKVQEAGPEKLSFRCEDCGFGKKENEHGLGYISAEYNAARNLAVWNREEKQDQE